MQNNGGQGNNNVLHIRNLTLLWICYLLSFVVLQLHREFLRAGADVMQAFSFFASNDKLSNRGNKAADYGVWHKLFLLCSAYFPPAVKWPMPSTMLLWIWVAAMVGKCFCPFGFRNIECYLTSTVFLLLIWLRKS